MRHSPHHQYISPAIYAQYRTITPLMRRTLTGRLIDIGCGDMPFRDYVGSQVTAYDSLDVAPRSEDVTFVGDVHDMRMIASADYDAAVCFEVLEHVADPFQAMSEIARILRPGGTFIISVPHLSRLHDVPHDYYRFTRYGLRHMLEQAGFEVLDMHESGGIFCFLGHQVSIMALSLAWPVPGVRQIVRFLNQWLVTRLCYQLDRCFKFSGMFAMGYVAVSRKRG
ncbi:MAG: class I SAM-dependent methyltransferase [Anaerolineae bacterium]|nr:class I SAM-dependent methyltransferase [Anaerolineae bacterium]